MAIGRNGDIGVCVQSVVEWDAKPDKDRVQILLLLLEGTIALERVWMLRTAQEMVVLHAQVRYLDLKSHYIHRAVFF